MSSSRLPVSPSPRGCLQGGPAQSLLGIPYLACRIWANVAKPPKSDDKVRGRICVMRAGDRESPVTARDATGWTPMCLAWQICGAVRCCWGNSPMWPRRELGTHVAQAWLSRVQARGKRRPLMLIFKPNRGVLSSHCEGPALGLVSGNAASHCGSTAMSDQRFSNQRPRRPSFHRINPGPVGWFSTHRAMDIDSRSCKCVPCTPHIPHRCVPRPRLE